MRCLALIATAVLLVACGDHNPRAGRSVLDNSHDWNVTLLFSVEGCRVYRFTDGWRFHYLTTCPGSVQQAATCGKNCEYVDRVDTITPPRGGR